MGSTLVLGCGYTGEALLRKLRGFPAEVRATTRSGANDRAIAALGARAERWSAPEPIDLDGVEVAIALFPPGDGDPDAAAAHFERVPRVVYCSSTGVYGSGDVDEDTPPAPSSATGRLRLAAEDAFRRRGAVVVRAVGIYGPDRNVVERHRAGRLSASGDLERPVNLIHVDDLAAVLLAAAGAPRGRVFIAADGHPVAWRELIALAEHVIGAPVPIGPPSPGAHATGEWRRCDNRRMREELGIAPAHPDALASLRSVYGVTVDTSVRRP